MVGKLVNTEIAKPEVLGLVKSMKLSHWRALSQSDRAFLQARAFRAKGMDERAEVIERKSAIERAIKELNFCLTESGYDLEEMDAVVAYAKRDGLGEIEIKTTIRMAIDNLIAGKIATQENIYQEIRAIKLSEMFLDKDERAAVVKKAIISVIAGRSYNINHERYYTFPNLPDYHEKLLIELAEKVGFSKADYDGFVKTGAENKVASNIKYGYMTNALKISADMGLNVYTELIKFLRDGQIWA